MASKGRSRPPLLLILITLRVCRIPPPGLLPLSVAAAASVLGTAACRSTEEALVERFLEASSRKDNETATQLSMVAFPEEVRSFTVLAVGRPTREPYPVPALRKRVAAAEDERDEQFKAFGDFRNRNYDELAKIQKTLREDPEARFSGHLRALQLQWEGFQEERRTLVTSLHDAQRDLEEEVRKVTKSLQREATPEYLAGEAVHESARVRVTTGGGAERIYVLVLTRYDVTNAFGGVVPTRWIVTEISSEDR
jgi:hypothetical protein